MTLEESGQRVPGRAGVQYLLAFTGWNSANFGSEEFFGEKLPGKISRIFEVSYVS